MDTYKYLFPYEKVSMGSRILIYGAGILGREYLKQIQITKYCQIVGFVDKNAAGIAPLGVPVYKPEQVSELDFDQVVVALRNDHFLRDIKRMLYEQGVAEETVVCVCQRDTSEACLPSNDHAPMQRDVTDLAYMQIGVMSIALYVKGGIGDMVIAKRFVEELIRLMPDCAIDLYTSYDLSWLYSDCVQINKLIRDNEVLYRTYCHKYVLAIMINAYFLEVDQFKPESIPEKYQFMIEKIERLKIATQEEHIVSNVCPPIVAYLRRIYKGYNCYTGYSYGGIFDIRDSSVYIPLEKKYEIEYKRLKLQSYITCNFGSGESDDLSVVSKAWPLSYYNQVITLFKKKFPNIAVVQLGAKGTKKIKGVDKYVLGKNFELVKYILKNAIVHLDIESGLVHLATQLGTKCIVLFGPSNIAFFGYAQNINITTGICQNCYGLYHDHARCARNLEKPECMWSITPEMVMERVEEYLKKY